MKNRKKWDLKYERSIKGVISALYSSTKTRAKKRGHNPPEYSKKELSDWLIDDKKFIFLYEKWEESGYATKLKPSIDRKDDFKSYTWENIQLMTVEENYKKPKPRQQGLLNYQSKTKEYYKTKGTLRGNFKKTCERRDWEFNDFTENDSGKKYKGRKLYTYM